MNIDDMVRELERYLEDAGFENVRERYLDNKSDEDIMILYEAASNDFEKHINI